jgi:hypothetical protein
MCLVDILILGRPILLCLVGISIQGQYVYLSAGWIPQCSARTSVSGGYLNTRQVPMFLEDISMLDKYLCVWWTSQCCAGTSQSVG